MTSLPSQPDKQHLTDLENRQLWIESLPTTYQPVESELPMLTEDVFPERRHGGVKRARPATDCILRAEAQLRLVLDEAVLLSPDDRRAFLRAGLLSIPSSLLPHCHRTIQEWCKSETIRYYLAHGRAATELLSALNADRLRIYPSSLDACVELILALCLS